MEKKYFYAKKERSGFTVRGLGKCRLGHVLDDKRGKPDGIYVSWRWDGQELIVENDRYGFFPVYYSSFDRQICISPSIPRLIAEGAPVDINEDALSVFFELGYFIGNDTPFRHIHALPPNVEFRWNGELTCIGGYYTYGKTQSSITRDEAMDTYARLFSKSIRRRPPRDNKFAVPLSGGRDSRHILLELNEQGYKPSIVVTAQNYPNKQTEDVQIAGMLAREMGLEHTILEQQASWFKSEVRKNIQTNLCSDEHAWLMVVADYLKDRVDTVYDGIAGDSLSESNFLNYERNHLYTSGNLIKLSENFLERAPVSRGFSRRALHNILPSDLVPFVNRKRAEQHLLKELEKHINAPNPVNSFTLWNRGRREIALVPFNLLSDIPTVYAPYLDHELFDFLTSLPVEMLLTQDFHTETIRRAYPAYAHIPFESKASNKLDYDFHRVFAAFGRELTWYLLLQRPSRYMRNTFLRSALLPSILSTRYSSFTRRFTTLALYLQQLDTLSRGIKIRE
ncbi:MAG: asparagine synthase C-terminal domain-containing protein [Balneolales bacterium]